ncbi:hypothetical protein AB0F11_35305, partial [Streptomyces sp. NPDC032472]
MPPQSVIPDPVSPLGLAAAMAEPELPRPEDWKRVVATPDGGYVVWARSSGSGPAPAPCRPDLLFVEGVGPGELLRRLGAVEDTVRTRSREEAEYAAAAPWAAYRPMVRAGAAGRWAYAVQDAGVEQFDRPAVLQRVSAGGRALAVLARPSRVDVHVYEDGRLRPKAVRRVPVVGEGGAEAAGFGGGPALGGLLGPGPEPVPYKELLAGLAEEFGISGWRGVGDRLAGALLLPLLDAHQEAAPQPPGPFFSARGVEPAAVIEGIPLDRLRAAVASQMVRLAGETGFDSDPEVARALRSLVRGEEVRLVADGPLDLRLRSVLAEARAARQMA